MKALIGPLDRRLAAAAREFAGRLVDRDGSNDLARPTVRALGWERFSDRLLPIVGAVLADAEVGASS